MIENQSLFFWTAKNDQDRAKDISHNVSENNQIQFILNGEYVNFKDTIQVTLIFLNISKYSHV